MSAEPIRIIELPHRSRTHIEIPKWPDNPRIRIACDRGGGTWIDCGTWVGCTPDASPETSRKETP